MPLQSRKAGQSKVLSFDVHTNYGHSIIVCGPCLTELIDFFGIDLSKACGSYCLFMAN